MDYNLTQRVSYELAAFQRQVKGLENATRYGVGKLKFNIDLQKHSLCIKCDLYYTIPPYE